MHLVQHHVVNVPHDDSVESTIARQVEELLDNLAIMTYHAEDTNSTNAHKYFEQQYDRGFEAANNTLGFDLQIMATMKPETKSDG